MTGKAEREAEKARYESLGEVSSHCWRHLAEQRSWAQHLKALAGYPCNVKKYKDPTRFEGLPAEVKAVADLCVSRRADAVRADNPDHPALGGGQRPRSRRPGRPPGRASSF